MSIIAPDKSKSSQITKKPLVTIVTPAYNQGEYLEATMRSVLTQDYPALEYIVIDDGSSDDSLLIAKRVASEYPGRVTVLTKPNSGQAETLNIGWGMAKGEILAYLSSDDCLMPQAVSCMVAKLQKNPEASVVYCDFWLIDAEGRRLRETLTEDFSVDRMCIDLICQPGPGAFFRRIVVDRTGGWNPALRQVPDFEFWLRALRHGPFVRVAESLAEYRIHEGSASFRAMSVDRANEIVRVVENYISGDLSNRSARFALARANAFASKNHAQSGRFFAAIICFGRALWFNPIIFFEFKTWRGLIAGFLRRNYYKLIFSMS